RPYFWNAISARQKRQQAGRPRSDFRWDYATNAYIDLGTNGPIKTYCWGFTGADLPGGPDSVLCVDIALSNAASVIKNNLERVNAKVESVQCDLESSSCLYRNGEPDVNLTYAAQSAKARSGQLEVFGGIYVISAQPIAFTVPIYTYMDKSNPQLMLFECTLDLKKNQARN